MDIITRDGKTLKSDDIEIILDINENYVIVPKRKVADIQEIMGVEFQITVALLRWMKQFVPGGELPKTLPEWDKFLHDLSDRLSTRFGR